MNTKTKVLLGALALGASAWIIVAQDSGSQPGDQTPPRRHPPISAVIRALDANHDGVVDADEIANAPAALKTLDKDGDGKLSMQELLGPPPQGRGGLPGNGPGDGNDRPPGPPPADQ